MLVPKVGRNFGWSLEDGRLLVVASQGLPECKDFIQTTNQQGQRKNSTHFYPLSEGGVGGLAKSRIF